MTDTVLFLLSDVARLARRRFDARARAIGVTRSQWRVLTMLGRNEGANQNGLADMLDVEPITLCRMIDRLEEAGLVERRRDPNDRRARRLHLTDKARPLIVRLRGVADVLTAEALRGLAPVELASLEASLETIRHNINQPVELQEVSGG